MVFSIKIWKIKITLALQFQRKTKVIQTMKKWS